MSPNSFSFSKTTTFKHLKQHCVHRMWSPSGPHPIVPRCSHELQLSFNTKGRMLVASHVDTLQGSIRLVYFSKGEGHFSILRAVHLEWFLSWEINLQAYGFSWDDRSLKTFWTVKNGLCQPPEHLWVIYSFLSNWGEFVALSLHSAQVTFDSPLENEWKAKHLMAIFKYRLSSLCKPMFFLPFI